MCQALRQNTTLTKLELEEDDADFFVNVGNLEVEDNEYGEQYDPLQDKEKQTTKTKKRKKSGSSTTTPAPKKKSKTPSKEAPDSAKSKKSTASTTSTKKKKGAAEAEPAENNKGLQKAAKKAKDRVDKLYKKVASMIKGMSDEDLPRKVTKMKVQLTCPANKKPGDLITFT